MNYNDLSKVIYENNVKVGWWDNKDSIDPLEKLQLVSTEIAEATEGERKNLMDDHLPHRKMGEVELADAMIRLLDFGGAYGYLFVPIREDFYEPTEIYLSAKGVAGMHLAINERLIKLASAHIDGELYHTGYSDLLITIKRISDDLGYDIEGAIENKRQYNANRADHKRENREKANGKKF